MSALSADAPSGDRSMNIGEVLAQLRPDFSDISLSKIRFLESKGLIAPQRAPSGYRRFSADDVSRLRLVLTAQRDLFLPLNVIKERLAVGDLQALIDPAPTSDDASPSQQAQPEPQPEVEVQVEERKPSHAPDIDPNQVYSRSELIVESLLPRDVVKQLEDYGVIQADPAGRFTGAHVLVCRAYAVLQRHGVDERHLRQVKNGASRDASLIEQSVIHLQSDDRTSAQAQMLHAFSEAHYWLVMCELNRSAPPSHHHARRNGR